MDRKSFIELSRMYLEKKLTVKPKDIETCLYGLVECVIRVVEAGEEVRIPPFGSFYPKLIYKPGTRDLAGTRVGFNSFAKTNERVYGRIRTLAAFRRLTEVAIEKVEEDRLYNTSEISRLTDLSYPTARKYLMENSDKLRFVETKLGRKYHKEAIDLLKSLRKQPITQRENNGYYTLTDISKKTNISTVTLSSYLSRYGLSAAKIERGRAYYDEAFLQKVTEIRRTNKELWRL